MYIFFVPRYITTYTCMSGDCKCFLFNIHVDADVKKKTFIDVLN